MRTWLVAATVFVTATAPAQVSRLWSFNELVAESDLVIIGTVVNVRDTGQRAIHPELRPNLPVVEVATEIHVLGTLKRASAGEPDGIRRVVLHHYRIDMDEWRRQHASAPGQPPASLVNTGEPLTVIPETESYLFFLKRGPLGWEPTTGHAFSNHSVFPLAGANRIRP
jgi:hypothetical protein